MRKEIKPHQLSGKLKLFSEALYPKLGKSDLPDFGKNHYIYSSPRGSISLILLKNYFLNREDWWETYCLEGDLFSDTERFKTLKEAEKRIRELLSIPKFRKLRPVIKGG
jgi:hypothetical protein